MFFIAPISVLNQIALKQTLTHKDGQRYFAQTLVDILGNANQVRSLIVSSSFCIHYTHIYNSPLALTFSFTKPDSVQCRLTTLPHTMYNLKGTPTLMTQCSLVNWRGLRQNNLSIVHHKLIHLTPACKGFSPGCLVNQGFPNHNPTTYSKVTTSYRGFPIFVEKLGPTTVTQYPA